MTDTSKYQSHLNGPLKPETAEFLGKIRLEENWTYDMLGKRLGISGGFAHRIINKAGNITTRTPMPKIAEGIARLEAGDTDFLDVPSGAANEGLLEHSFHLREGLQVTFALPADLTEREAERLTLFVRSLAQ